MLNKLKSFGQTEGYFEIKKIGDFKNSKKEGFENITTKAIDFDNTKEVLQKELKLQCFKSCDALDIINTKNKINFIEFKQIDDKRKLDEFIKKLELPRKIKDSREVILNIIRKQKFIYKNKIGCFNKSTKNFIVCFKLIENKTETIAFYTRFLTVKSKIEAELNKNYIQGENFNEPIYMLIKDFDKKYITVCS